MNSLRAIVVAVGLLFLLAACGSKEPSGETLIVHIDYVDITSSIEYLSNKVDVIVIGTVSDVVGSHSRGATYRFDVEETLKGEVADSIYVDRTPPPWSSDIPPPYTKLNVGERLALYMERTSPTRYQPLVFDNGVFDVEVVDGELDGVVNEMNSRFEEIAAQMKPLLQTLQRSELLTWDDLACKVPERGIYVFYEGRQPIYTGRSRRMKERIRA